MKKLIIFFIYFSTFTLLVFCISSCGAGIPTGDEQTDKKLFVDMGTYSVSYPVGDDWTCRDDKFNRSIIFKRSKQWWTGRVLGETTINIYENTIKADTFTYSEKQFADEYRKNELKNLKEKALNKPEDILIFDTLLNGKKFYCLSYNSDDVTFLFGNVMESMMALHFPSEFNDKHTFYVFLINDTKEADAFTENERGQLYPVLKSSKLKKETF